MLRAVFVDLDDTIIDTKKVCDDARRSVYTLLEQNYAPLSFSYQEFRSLTVARNAELRNTEEDASIRTPKSFTDIAKKLVPTLSEKDEKAIHRIGNNTFTTIGPLKKGVEEALSTLARAAHHHGIKVYILTQGAQEWQQEKIETLPPSIREVFDDVFIVSNKTVETYGSVLTSLKLAPHEALMIGDKEGADIFPALKAGMRACFIPAYKMDFPSIDLQSSKYKDVKTFQNLGECVSSIIDEFLANSYPSRSLPPPSLRK